MDYLAAATSRTKSVSDSLHASVACNTDCVAFVREKEPDILYLAVSLCIGISIMMDGYVAVHFITADRC